MSDTSQQSAGKYVQVNELKMYYEVHGSGQPLIALHGGLGGVDMFGSNLPILAEGRQVIAAEVQAHGHTADIARPLSYAAMADDIAALIEHLGLESTDIFGYSLGGGIALQTAIRHPQLVRKLVLVSTSFKRNGWSPETLVGFDAINAEAGAQWVGSPYQQQYASVAPRPEDWVQLVAKMGDMLRQDYDWSADVAQIKSPTLIVIGDTDSVRLSAVVELFELLGGGADAMMIGIQPTAQLAILPGTNHLQTISQPLLLPIVTTFLDAPLPEA